jgi:hypothetical protein
MQGQSLLKNQLIRMYVSVHAYFYLHFTSFLDFK